MTSCVRPRPTRKPIRARSWLFLLAGVACGLVQAQPVLGPDDAVRMALSRPEIARGIEAGVDLARSEVIDARTWSNPELRFGQERADAVGEGDAIETSMLLSQEVEVGGRRGLQRRAAELGVDAAHVEAMLERRELQAETLRRYYALVVAEQRMQAHERVDEGLSELARVANERFRAGDLSGFDSGRIAQRRVQAQARLAEAEAERLQARASLAAVLGLQAQGMKVDMYAPVLPASIPPRPQADPLPPAGVTALELRRDQADAAVRAADRWALPVTVGIGRKRFETLGGSDEALLLEVSTPLPLFDRNQAARMRTRAEAARAHARYRQSADLLHARRDAAWQEATRLAETARRLRDDAVPRAAELADIARTSFGEGELDLLGLLDALDAQAGVIDQSLDLQYRARLAAIELQQLSPYASNQE